MRPRNSWPKILDALTEPMHAQQLASIVFLDPRTVARVLKEMHTEDLVHVKEWIHRRPQGPYLPVYAYGPGKSVPHPTAYTPAQKARRYRARLTVSQRESFLQRRRVVKPDIASSWLTTKKDLHEIEE